MLQEGFESRVKVQQVLENQLPEFILDESPKTLDFLKQYYISQEYQGGPTDIVENLDQYLKLDNLTPEVVVGYTSLSNDITTTDETIAVTSTKGFPKQYGLIKIDDEIITYTGISTNTFTGCIRGFSGITNYHKELNQEELVFSTSEKKSHTQSTKVQNLSSLFLQEFYKKLKYTLTPGLENVNFDSDLNVGNFIKEANTLYKTKGTSESFRILFNVLFGETPRVIDLEKFLTKPSSADYLRRKVVLAEAISGNPSNLSGQTIFKTTDSNTTASVSEVEIINRKGKTYYKISLFVGYDDSISTITGSFNITGSSKNLNYISVGSSIITVDSTVGFSTSGTIYSGENKISYNDKSINQFFGCSGITVGIPTASTIYSSETYYGYEDGDLSKKVEFRITGVLSGFENLSIDSPIKVGDQIEVKSVGEIIENPVDNQSKKEIFANSWIYNTSSRYQIDSLDSNGTILTLKSAIDKSSLDVNDQIDILVRDSQQIVQSNIVQSIDVNANQITIGSSFSGPGFYDIRRKIKTSSSSIVPLEFDSITSDIQNVYNENDEYMYVASNSLPSYTISQNIFTYNASGVSGYDEDLKLYSTITFSSQISFRTGNRVYYKPSGSAISGLSEGFYYIEVISNVFGDIRIKLYYSRSLIGSSNYLKFGELTSGSHNFKLDSQKEDVISAQKLLRKFPISSNIKSGGKDLTVPGSVGMLVNGVEILNYKNEDKVYYGPLKEVKVLNGGENYDVINPPLIQVSEGSALIQPVVSGSIEKVFVDPQDFDINVEVTVSLTGGNGKGASFSPVVTTKRREIEFDARQLGDGNGGVDINYETITFISKHYLNDGAEVIYRPGNNSPLGIGTFLGSNANTGNTLVNESIYYAKYINDTTIQLYPSLLDYTSGINTVGFTTVGTSGIHKFATEVRNTLSEIKVLNGGSEYTNRKLRVLPSGISTTNNLITFENHGFNSGELIKYSYTGTQISGLSTTNQYYVIKLDEDNFRLSDAGIGGTITTNFNRGKYISLGSTIGSGYHIFNYPEISLTVEYVSVGLGTTQTKGTIIATPIVKGKIIDTYVYEQGSNYGSTILNYHKKPSITIKNGKNAQLTPVIVDGKITNVIIQSGGTEYYSTPDIEVIGDGIGANLKAVITNNKISNIVIVNSGYGYTEDNTSIIVKSSGKNAILDPIVRSLSVNNNVLYDNSSEIIKSSYKNLQYFVSNYSESIQDKFNDTGNTHSKIIGWAYDGNPIYGSYGYSNPNDINSNIKRLEPGYSLDVNNISNRPSTSVFSAGFFIEDYKFTNSGDLDEHNGRFCITDEFPNGTYAYFATSEEDINGNFVGTFPYFIGNSYRSVYVKENKYLNQSFDFNSSKLIRNTLPYKVSDQYAGNDFIIESNEIINQKSVIESITGDSISDFEIIGSGNNYKVNDLVEFDETQSGDYGLDVRVAEIEGKEILDIQTSSLSYTDATFTWDNDKVKVTINPNHNLSNLDYVSISGFSTSLSELNAIYQIGVTTYASTLLRDIPSYATTGIVTDIYISSIPENISIGSSLSIETENFSILNIFSTNNLIRVSRESTGSAHTATTLINFVPDSFYIDKSVNYFESKTNDKVYFNPVYSVGVGTTSGIGIGVSFNVGETIVEISIPTQSIYLPNHPFKTNQRVILNSPASLISVANTSTSAAFSLSNPQTVYIINKSKNYIGIVTQVGLTTNTNGLFFLSNGSNDYRYSFESDFTQVKGNVDKTVTTVSVSTSHNLITGDEINLNVKPNLTVGIGTSTSIKVKRDELTGYLLINAIGFNSTGINTSTNIINLPSHNLKTGNKIKYSADLLPSGITTGFYYVYKVDNNKIKLSETYYDTQLSTPTTVSFGSTGGSSQSIYLLNPEISVIRNNNLSFDLSDSSLVGYQLKIFYDKEFKNEFISTGSSESFSIVNTGTIGSNGSLVINYDQDIPPTLFYTLEKSGVVQKSDEEVKNYSQISFIDSYFNNSYKISGIGTTTFTFNLSNPAERSSYNNLDCDILEYSTTSKTALGGIKKVKSISSGSNYTSLPIFSKVTSESGEGAYIIPKSNTIGKINQFRILNEGFEYSSDKTLRPQANISKFATIKNSNFISKISVTDGGKNYLSAPNLIVIDSTTKEKINSGSLVAKLTSNSIESVEIISSPKGLSELTVELKSINNSNGIKIQEVNSSSGIVTCTLVTPLSGFAIEPFAQNDKIFVEGIEKYSNDGDGFNSEDYGYDFFTISNYQNAGTNLARKVTFNLSGLTTNTGVAKTNDILNGNIINYNNYPKFSIEQSFSDFIIGEQLEVNTAIVGFTLQDLKIIDSNKNYIKLSGLYEIQKDDIIRGVQSGSIATINEVKKSFGEYKIDFSYLKSIGWNDNIGKLNEDTQVIPDNDYYQNLSYTIKTKQGWDSVVSPVNNLLHPSGLKNFVDTEIINATTVGIGSTQNMNIFYDIITENRVDTINNFDLVYDIDVVDQKSKFIKFENKKLTDYIQCNTNRVLDIDDISSEFSTNEEATSFDLTYDGIPIFMKTFDPSSDLDLSTGLFSIDNHFFNTGEQLIYRPGDGGNVLGIGSTLNYVGVVTDTLPDRIYVIKETNNTFKLSSREEYATLGIAITFTSVGVGNTHELEMVKKSEKSIISINNIVQSPISYSLLNFNVDNGGQISTASTIFGLSGISSIRVNDILKIDNEYMKISSVGFGTTYSGPISFAGTFPLVEVERGFVGTSATTHANSGIASIYRGSFDIVKNTIYFTEPPSGNLQFNNTTFIVNVSAAGTIGIATNVITGISTSNIEVGQIVQSVSGLIVPETTVSAIGIGSIYISPSSVNSVGIDTFIFNFGSFADYNLPEFNSYFSGRVFLRKDYTTNKIYDNISENFTGVGRTYTLTVNGANSVGLGTSGGNGIVFINGVYQTPTTANNLNNNFSILEDTISGISSIVFSGITSSNGSIVISNSDINQNQLPRGGVIVSLGSTPGLGYAPLVGASVTAIIGAGGSITSIGIGTTGNWGSGYRGLVSVAITEYGHTGSAATITASVGAGGTLSFAIVGGGTGYVNPIINIPSPSYDNLSIIGVSRLGIGTTTDCGTGLLLNIDVGASTTTGIGSTLFEVTGFNIIRSGYQFRKGDVVKPVGLVTAYGLSSPISEFELTILDTYTDSFSAWQFGEIDYIDSIKNYQNGSRRRFPLYYNNSLLSFQKNSSNPDSQLIDFDNLLIIFINGILQQPKVSYTFNGGTSFIFTQAPKEEDKVDIYFYKGSSQDSESIDIYETVKVGDEVQIFSANNNLLNTKTQEVRIIYDILNVDTIETNLYDGSGVSETIVRPLSWSKQKKDVILNGEFISKSRDSIEPQIYPTAKIISNLSSTDSSVYIDNSNLFEYEVTSTQNFDAIIISGDSDPVSAAVTAVVSSAGTIQSLSIGNSGSGYVGAAITVSISSPPAVIVGFGTTLSVGVGTTATASISIVNGSLDTVTITNPGSGYTFTNPPQVLVPYPEPVFELIKNISFTNTTGGSGNIVGIATTVGIGTDLALQFTYNSYSGSTIQTNDYIYIFDTKVGSGVTSIISSDSQIVGVGTTFVDNIYKISSVISGSSGIITCNIHSQTSIVGIATTGVVGKFSWGKFTGFTRSTSPIAIAISGYQVDSGLSTFPTIQRRKLGLRSTGAIKKEF